MAAVVYRGRSQRSRRLKGRQDNGDEIVTLDFSKDPADNQRDILVNLVNHNNITKSKRLGYYNAFVRLCYKYGTSFKSYYSNEEILSCLRLGLFHDAKEMRAGCLRAIRFFCQDQSAVKAILKLRIDLLIARSLDLCLDNELERIHALRLIRHLMHISPKIFPTSLLNVMVSIAQGGTKERDRMVRSCLSTLSEIAFLNPELVARHGVFTVLLTNVLECHQLPRINESLLVAMLCLLNHPHTRHLIKPEVDFEQLLAPFTDCHFKLRGESSESSSEERENQFAACKMALATIMKSWPGIIRLCKPDGTALQSLFGVLYLPIVNTRREIMDLVYDVFRLPLPEWTDDFLQALISIDPSEMRESWRLSEGFVAEEGKSLLTNLAKTRTNLVDNHIALLLSTFISAGLLESLVEMIITSEDTHISVRATILLGELLHMASTMLPHESGHHSHCLPTMMALASSFDVSPEEQNRARRTITYLNRLHAMKKRGPIPCSLYLDRIVQCGIAGKEEPYKPLMLSKDKLVQAFEQQDSDHDVIHQAIKDSCVLQTKENFSWDWDLISAILKWPDDALKKFEDQSNQRFIRRLIYFFKPTNKLFSTADHKHQDVRSFFQTGLYFIDFLLSGAENVEDASKFIEEFLGDINRYIAECCQPSPPHDSLFNPTHLAKTCSQYYFLLIGRFAGTQKGEKFLESTGIFQSLLNLLTLGCHDTYVKLIVSSMDYSKEGLARALLSKALKASSENAKLYTVNFMRVLLRAKVPYISNWGLEMLVMQLYDQSKTVAMEALSVISEACENEANLYTLVKMRPSVLHLGHKGEMLLARFLSIPKGFRFLQDANYITQELERWHKVLCTKYVEIVEERLNEALTTYEKTYDGTYVRRSHRRQCRADVFVPIHLYGQLVQHKYGYSLLTQQEYLEDYFDMIREGDLYTEQEIIQVKAALWAVGHIGTSVWGLGLLQEQAIISDIIKLAEESGVFSIRGTAFYVLGLIACTRKGADALNDFGWETVRHSHGEMWSVVEDMELLQGEFTPSVTPNISTSSLSLSTNSKLSPEPDKILSYPRMPSLTLSTSTNGMEESGRNSPYSENSSPKVAFVIGSFDPRSRSDTETSGQTGSNYQGYDIDGSEHGRIMIEISEPPEDDIRCPDSVESQSNLESLPEDSMDSLDGKLRSQSMTENAHVKDPTIHPRSNSDPREARLDKTERRTDGGASVHFNIEDSDKEDGSLQNMFNKHLKSNHDALRKRTSSEDSGHLSKNGHLSIRDERSNSSESARVTPATTVSCKSRSDSLFTDTSSGFSSFDSSHYQGASSEPAQLTPIPSASSLITEQSSSQQSESSRGFIHPSDYHRKIANLKRIRSLSRRCSNPVLGHISPSNTLQRKKSDHVIFTSARDLQGYATLRELKINRTLNSAMEGETNSKGVLLLDSTTSYSPTKTKSLDFRLGNFRKLRNSFRKTKLIPKIRPSDNFLCGCGSPFRQNFSSTSLDELDSPLACSASDVDLNPRISTSNLKRLQTTVGRAEYCGICLPVDINMIFQVNEGEDPRSCKPEYVAKHTGHTDCLSEEQPSKHRSVPDCVSQSEDYSYEFHTVTTCMACIKIRQSRDEIDGGCGRTFESDGEETFYLAKENHNSGFSQEHRAQTSPLVSSLQKTSGVKSRNSSLSDTTADSTTSNTSMESSAPKVHLSEDTPEGRALLRKEVLRFIVNLSSSIGVKSAEQGLLNLKQKFPSAFQELCLYHEVSCMLANYKYRLPARRLVQELFQDVLFDQLYDQPRLILGIENDMMADLQGPTEIELRLDRVLESIA